MEYNREEDLRGLMQQCRNYIRSGQIDLYSGGLKEIADLMEREGYDTDQLKMLLSAFYIDLSGFARAPYIDHSLMEKLRAAVDRLGFGQDRLERFYLELIQPDMVAKHVLGVKDSLYLLRLCIAGKMEQAEYILSKI